MKFKILRVSATICIEHLFHSMDDTNLPKGDPKGCTSFNSILTLVILCENPAVVRHPSIESVSTVKLLRVIVVASNFF